MWRNENELATTVLRNNEVMDTFLDNKYRVADILDRIKNLDSGKITIKFSGRMIRRADFTEELYYGDTSD